MIRISLLTAAILFSGLCLNAQDLDRAFKHIFSWELGTYNFREYKDLQPGVQFLEVAYYDGVKQGDSIAIQKHFYTLSYEYDEQGRIIWERRIDEQDGPIVQHIYNEKGQYVRYEVTKKGQLQAYRNFTYNKDGKLINCFEEKLDYKTHEETKFSWDGDIMTRVEIYNVDDELSRFREYNTTIEGDRIIIKFDEFYVEDIKYEEYDGLGSETWICNFDGKLLERIYDPIDKRAMTGQVVMRYDPVTDEMNLEGMVDPEAGLSPNLPVNVIPPFTHKNEYTYSDLDERGNWQQKIKVSDHEEVIGIYQRKFTYR